MGDLEGVCRGWGGRGSSLTGSTQPTFEQVWVAQGGDAVDAAGVAGDCPTAVRGVALRQAVVVAAGPAARSRPHRPPLPSQLLPRCRPRRRGPQHRHEPSARDGGDGQRVPPTAARPQAAASSWRWRQRQQPAECLRAAAVWIFAPPRRLCRRLPTW